MVNTCVFYLYLADLHADPAVVERNIKRLQVDQSKTAKNEAVDVVEQFLSVTFEAHLQQRLKRPDGKNHVQTKMQEWPIIGKEIYASNFNHLHDQCFQNEPLAVASNANFSTCDAYFPLGK